MLTTSVMLRGTVAAAQAVDLVPAGAGTEGSSAVVTKLPVASGQVVQAGTVLLEVSGRPVFALKGQVPVYRDLKPGAKGDDVAQLQRALDDLGHNASADETGYFGSATKKALAAFYEQIGYDPRPAQPDGEGEAEGAQEAVTAAKRAVEDAKDALAAVEHPRSQTSSVAGSTAATAPGEGKSTKTDKPSEALRELRKQVKRADEDLQKAQAHLSEVQETVGPMLPASEVIFLGRFPARVDSVKVQVGSPVSGTAMSLSAGVLQVRGYLEQHEKGLVRRGQPVEILSEMTGLSVAASVATVATTRTLEQASSASEAKEGEASASAGGYLMIVKPSSTLPAELVGQDVRLTVQAASTKGKALVVPVSAISAGADGKTAVTVVAGNGSQRRISVDTGATGDGYVEIRPSGEQVLHAGEQVITGIRPSTAEGPEQ
ncbi:MULTISPECIES: peptidoglycan-binding protein [Streptomyces]|uniref:Peptidoglycan-binding protein n=2 Tax=Streptomyces TaxID=1883 RepID=A0ABU4KAH0_9ACTN|nr:peptidoglycan-binding protein [Streptomyces roseolus]MDX2294422.1 peptidoglycan-binding protein [Streptomyces roseolus]